MQFIAFPGMDDAELPAANGCPVAYFPVIARNGRGERRRRLLLGQDRRGEETEA